jgi:hypothetical protein
MSQLDPVQQIVLEQAAEDWYGLFELLFDVDPPPPGLPNANERRAQMELAVRRLLEAGLVELSVRTDPYADPVPVVPSDAFTLLSADSSWAYPAPDSSIVVVTTTPLGDQVYHAPSNPIS